MQRMTVRRAALVLLGVSGFVAACVPPPPPPPPAPLSFPCDGPSGSPVSGNDPLRSGWYPDQPGLNPSAGGECAFGELWSAAVDGQVYAAPLVDPGAGAHGTLLVATETNHVYGIDAVNGTTLWQRDDLGPPWDPNDLACEDLTPAIGITSTPAIDPATHTAYLFSKTYATGVSGPAQWKAHAIDLATGNEKPNFPVVIQGAADNDPTVSFEPTHHLQRPGLLLMNGVVYAAFGGHCDAPDYRGWVVGVSNGGQITARWADEALTAGINSPGGGIWQSGGRLVSDKPGEMLVVSGNGVPPLAPLPGTTPPTTLGESAVRLRVVTTPGLTQGKLQAVDFFSPCNALQLSLNDDDIGSGAPLVLPDSFGTPAHPHLVVVVGKEGPIYLLDRDDFGGFQQGPPESCPDGSGNAGDNVVNTFTLPNAPGIWATPAMWPGDGGSIYVPYPTFGNPGKLTSYNIVDLNGQPTFSLAGQSEGTFGYGSSSAIVTSNGTASGSGLVWIVFLPNSSGVDAELRAYDPNPVGGELQLRGSWAIGTGNKFTTPTVSAGRIYVGARDGNVRAFGVIGQSAQSQPPSRSGVNAVPAVPDRER
jgi:hypothetical protein